MDWWLVLTLFFGGLVLLVALRIPFAFAMFGATLLGAIYYYGFGAGLSVISRSVETSLRSFTLVPIVAFVLMGDLMFRTGVAGRAIDTMLLFFRRVPGRLGILTIGAGALLGIVSGSTAASIAILASTLYEKMRDYDYSAKLGIGAILASGGLAMIIPPSGVVVVFASIAGLSVGKLLLAGLLPGLLMAVNYLVVVYIWSRWFGGAPRYVPDSDAGRPDAAITHRWRDLVRYVLPLGLIVFMVLGTIMLGIATPTESGALGVVAALLLGLIYRQLSVRKVADAARSTAHVIAMILLLIGASATYSQIMTISGATRGFVGWLTALDVSSTTLLAILILIVLFLGAMLETVAIILVTVPFFMPIVEAAGWDPIWFGIVIIIAIQIGLYTPPFGLSLFILKGTLNDNTKLATMFVGVLPFIFADIMTIVILTMFPAIVTVLPDMALTR